MGRQVRPVALALRHTTAAAVPVWANTIRLLLQATVYAYRAALVSQPPATAPGVADPGPSLDQHRAAVAALQMANLTADADLHFALLTARAAASSEVDQSIADLRSRLGVVEGAPIGRATTFHAVQSAASVLGVS